MSGIGRSLINAHAKEQPEPLSPHLSADQAATEDLTFGFDDYDAGPDPPILALRAPMPQDAFGRSPPVFGSSALFAPAPAFPSGLSQTYQSGSSPRAAFAPHVTLAGQRRLSSHNPEQSPSRLRQLQGSTSATRRSFGATDMLGAAPLAVPQANGVGESSIFGTSPFSGSRALFLPSSYDSDDGFPRSPRIRTPWDEPRNTVFSDDDDEEEYDEGFLPSSLNDLLTPEEQRRRSSRMMGHGSGSGNHFDPFQNSQSVPAEFHLARGRPTSSAIPSKAWETYSPPLVPRSLLTVGSPPAADSALLSASPSLRAQILTRNNAAGLYSASFDPSSTFGNRYTEFSPRASPKTLAKNLLPVNGVHVMGSSLPKGLAGALSSLHFIPAEHSGETPPSTTGYLPVESHGSWRSSYPHDYLQRQREETMRASDPSRSDLSPPKRVQALTSPLQHNLDADDHQIQFDMED